MGMNEDQIIVNGVGYPTFNNTPIENNNQAEKLAAEIIALNSGTVTNKNATSYQQYIAKVEGIDLPTTSDTLSLDTISGTSVTKQTITSTGTNNKETNLNAGDTSTDKEVSTKDNVENKNNPIMDFLRLVVGAEFQKTLRSVFEKPGFSTLYQVIKQLLQKIYYNFYTVPNLPNGKCIIIKPETFFVKIPKCNVIFPCMKSQIVFSRSPKLEPTRILFITDPLQITGASGTKFATVAAIKFADPNTNYKSGDIEVLAASTNAHDEKDSTTWPVYNLTKYEEELGPRLFNDLGGGDLMAFIEAKAMSDKTKNIDSTASAEALKQLAKYKLLQTRYAMRSGTVQTYFNPYITPGFPMASLEPQVINGSVNFNVYGYVTNVVHNISDSSWTTTVSFGAATTDGEVRPDAFPVVETDYEPGNIETTYKNLFGSSDAYTTANISGELSKYTEPSTTVTDAYNFVKRPASTVAEYYKGEMSISQDGNVMKLSKTNFRTQIQEAILSYSKDILDNNKHYALHTNDVR